MHRILIVMGSLLFLTSCSKQSNCVIGQPEDTRIQVCFTPGQDCTAFLIDQINASQKNIKVQAYFFTSYKIANALIQAQKRGVEVQVILDKSQFDPTHFSVRPALQKAKIKIYEDDHPKIAHNKVMIFDDDAVMTGSFNFTYSAQTQNAENMIIIENKDVAKAYLHNWNARKKQSNHVQ